MDEFYAWQAGFRRLQKIYQAAGAPTACQLYIGDGGHRYYKAPAWPFIQQVFNK